MLNGSPDPVFFYHKPVLSPYSEVPYSDPTFGPWKEWFAWYPVKIIYWNHHEDGFGKGIRYYKWTWGTVILRRRVIDLHDGPGRESASFQSKHWEYTTLMDMLKRGH